MDRTVILVDGKPRSSCCKEILRVSRQVHDMVIYTPEEWNAESNILDVRYATVYPGEADEFDVECGRCHEAVSVDVNEL